MKDDVIKRVPVNRLAAQVTGKGVSYEPRKRVKRRGRLVVVGLYGHQPMRYVMRCQCGTYTVRKSKTLRNEANYDMCEHCRHLMTLKRSEHWRRTGKDISWQELDGVAEETKR